MQDERKEGCDQQNDKFFVASLFTQHMQQQRFSDSRLMSRMPKELELLLSRAWHTPHDQESHVSIKRQGWVFLQEIILHISVEGISRSSDQFNSYYRPWLSKKVENGSWKMTFKIKVFSTEHVFVK